MFHGTTVICIRHNESVAIAADGQVTFGPTVLKRNAKKIRRLYNETVLAGFAGATAEAFTLFERFEGKLEQFSGNLVRAAVELAKDWRTDRILRRLEAILAVADAENLLMISGTGDVLEPEDGIVAIGSGANFALAAARAFRASGAKLTAKEIATQSLQIAADICIYTNDRIVVEELPSNAG